MTLTGPAPEQIGDADDRADWVDVCDLADLVPERGAAALLGDAQVALFRLGDDTVHALDHRDPATGATVLARGLVGTAGGEWYVASPLLKHRYALADGRCLDDAALSVRVHAVTVEAGTVRVRVDRS